MARLLQRLFLTFSIIMLIDTAFFGPGLVLPGIGVSLRRLLFTLILVVLALRRAMSARSFTAAEITYVALFSAFAFFWGVMLPSSYGYPAALSFADISPWLGLLILALWPWDAWPSEAQWNHFCKFVVLIALILALIHIAIWALLVSNVVTPEVLEFGAALITPSSDGESFLIIVPLEGGQYRVFWSSSIFLLGGVYFLIAAHRPKSRWWVLGLVVSCFALAATYIRAFLGALGIFAVLMAAFHVIFNRRRAIWPVGTVLGLWVISILSVSAAINPAVLSALGLSRDVSDVDRVEQASALIGQFATHPLLGTGFGSYVSQVIRSDSRFSYELVFYALLMKLGVLGSITLLVLLGMGLRLMKIYDFAAYRSREYATWLAFSTGMWFAGSTNPMVTNFVGMTIVVLLFVDVRMRSSARL